ncbi:RNA polymerase subunit sigma [Xaviernesmea oryzae]|uniref:RNA polymerase subunit sigma n=1 Tax=Xaviernesmea oryzae TaxID=464029 RepID=A0A1Q9AS08_9HYPH|nr:sigma-70 family RNA polymerase sigma factor [Xaviernesmea oryzae]OLP58214.1 RNA polymerase subunit sigma [Xaviernesmea oryzae]SEL46332.1 RNA polymerase sigma-70 factor, ECF subfamily [Xaviernesmea oryzae]
MDKGKTPFDVIGQLGALRRYARALTRNPHDAEDLVHDALVRAYERRPSFRTGENLGTWLRAILHNVHIDGLRRRRSQESRAEGAALVAEQTGGPVQEEAVRLGQIREAFASLPEEQRAALHLVAVDELSYAEAAKVLGIPVGTLMSRIARARTRLRALEEGRAPDSELDEAKPDANAPGVRIAGLKIVGGTDNDAD